jgi:ATP-dependent DNA helicase DinG
MKPIYAVVDLETTGTDPSLDRIIQFGCVLIQDGQVINRFATDINPDRNISKQIRKLTGISNQQVKKAPYFEDVAHTIYNLLSQTIFVAHNIYFDYHFLSEELVRCGLPPLSIPGIDTVELAQVFLPTESSFRLGDLAESLGLVHENPHQADSDAEVTAALLLYIESIMRELPWVTLKQIAQLSGQMGMQTSQYIQRIINEQEKQPLPDYLEEVDGLVLRKKQVALFESSHFQEEYPRVKEGKMKRFAEHLSYRKQQARLMNIVYEHFSQGEKNLIVEAETGMGKTIGYLFPASYLATPENPLIISTTSILLQNQILAKDIPLVNQVLVQPLQATVVKSHQHYIDLQRFKATLDQPLEQKQYALYQMGILVWLTKTETGDFDELNLVRLDHPLFLEIRHRGVDFLAKNQPFYTEDFVRHLYKKVAQSNVLIVNHAFLMQENRRQTPLLPMSDFLLIDEAQHLPEVAERYAQYSFDSSYFKRQFLQVNEEGLFVDIKEIVASEFDLSHLFSLYVDALKLIIDTQEAYFATLTIEAEELTLVHRQDLYDNSLHQDRLHQKMALYYKEVLEIQTRLQATFIATEERRLARERIVIARLFDYFNGIEEQATTVQSWLNNWQPRYVHWIMRKSATAAVIEVADLQGNQITESKWYSRYKHILYLGGTLKIPGNKSYFAHQLGIPDATVKTIPAFYDYEKQAKLFIIKQGISIQQATSEEYAQYLADALAPILFENLQPTLVLFTAHDTLKRVYDKLHKRALEHGRELAAQGTGGSREKIIKRFLLAENGILFGTDSFWEGIDLPGQALKIAVVTRLPFENPKRPLVQARHAFLASEGIDSFKEDALPKAIIRMRQAFGRLIRSESDQGVMVVLDRRILSTKYGKRILKGLPKNLPTKEATPQEMTEEMRQFFDSTAEIPEKHFS